MQRTLLMATAAALIAGAGFANAQSAQTPPGSPPNVANQEKQAPRTGDTSKVGGTPQGDRAASSDRDGPLTKNNAPLGSRAETADQVKQAPRTGDSSGVGGTPAADAKGIDAQRHGGPPVQNNAPLGSQANKKDEIKQAPRTGDSSKVGGTQIR
jgi:hypothetical protein